ncbi:MAG: polysaccharide pyruvyl transferase family protein [Butyrivibrio sp.]|nr:polysaccharide pyruvyl transferase family protein [Butyrivibrio sp.]
MNVRQRLIQTRKRLTRNLKCLDGRVVRIKKVNLEWWQHKKNVGDQISPVICNYMLEKKGLSFDSKAKKTKHLMALGSICGEGQIDSVVWGSGIHTNELKENILLFKNERKLDIRAVRGPETEHFLNENGISCPQIYGDPAIIMPLIYQPHVSKKYSYSLVLHILMKNMARIPDDANLIDIETDDYKHFIDELAASEKIISSSLHGIILAESYGIPAIFFCEGVEDQMMKYKDWYESTKRPDFRYAKSIEEALAMEPMPLPDLSVLREKLMDVFPYDLWV